MPPASSALDLYFAPKRFPIHTPAAENKNVVRPMTGTEGTSGTCRKANVTPTASASIESAIASGNMTFGENDASNFSILPMDSRIMLTPMSKSSANDSQWSTLWMAS